MIETWPEDASSRANQAPDFDPGYRSLFESAAVGMCFFGLDGTFLAANGTFCGIVGYGCDELLATTCVALAHHADRDALEAILAEMLACGRPSATLEKRLVAKDGSVVWCGLALALIDGERGTPAKFACVVEDIGERKRAAKLLEESESLLRVAGQAAHLGGWAYDYATRRITLSDEVCSIFEIPSGSSPDFGFAAKHFVGDAEVRLAAAAERSRREGEDFDLEFAVDTARGARRWVRAIGIAGGDRERLVGALQDVTARRAADLEMVRTNRALKMLSGCNEVLVRATDERALLDEISRIVVDVGGYDMMWVGFARHDAARTVEPVAIAGHHDGYFTDIRISWDENDPAGRGAAGQTLRSGEVTVVEDLWTDPRFVPWRAQARKRGYRSVVVLPLCDGNGTFGVMGLHSIEVYAPPPAELVLLQELANDLAFGICHLRAQAEQRRIQEAIVKISVAVSARGGNEFLEHLIASMADAVGAQAAYLIRAHPTDPAKLRTLAAVVDGVALPNVDFDADGSPCSDVGLTEWFVVEDALSERYPSCVVAASIGAKAVIGYRLKDAAERTLATAMIFFREPLRETNFVISTVKIFIARAEAELERQISDSRIAAQASWLDRARDAIVVRDETGRISYWNEGAERLYGWSRGEACGTPLGCDLFASTQGLRDAAAAVVTSGFWNGEIEHRRKNGDVVWADSRWTIVANDDGASRSILSIDTDITTRIAAEREIEHLAYFDALTNLPNRVSFVQRLTRTLVDCRAAGALLFIDLDNFKSLNDTLGHAKGDLLLQRVALRLKASVRSCDIVARFGGDEFVIMLEELASPTDEASERAHEIATSILKKFAEPYELDGHAHRCTPSIGIALFERGADAEELLRAADLAMYQAKAAGRNAIRLFDPDMQALATSRRVLEDDMRAALAAREFNVVYQPQVDARATVIGAEALARWSHARHGDVSPAEFIPIGEESGLIVELGQFVLESACARLVAWSRDASTADLKLSVNVSAREFRHPDFVARATATIAASGADPRRLVLELTESVFVDEIDVVIAKMAALREIGVGFSLDDFGTGYSSLSYLKRLPLNQLKIDRSFVRDVLVDGNDAVIARTIIALGQNLSLDVIAEGVETEAQQRFLESAGCRSFQGFLYSRPLSDEAFDAFVRLEVSQTK